MKILFVTEVFNPEPHIKGLSFAKELVRKGHHVQVLTGFPNYPGGVIYPNYKLKLFQKESIDGIPIVRVPLYCSHNNSSLKRFLTYVSFALSAAFIGIWLVQSADIVYIYQPPATIAFPGLILRLFRAKRSVYDIQDMWPDTLTATGMVNSRVVLWCVKHWCLLTYRLVDHIVVQSKGFRELLLSRGVPNSKIEIVYNWADEFSEEPQSRSPELANNIGFNGRFNVLFAGTMGKAQGLDTVLETASLLQNRQPSIQLSFMGGGIDKERLQEKSRALGLTNVSFLERVPASDVGKILILADILLVHLKDDPLFRITIPSKTQGYLAVGRPILMAVRGESGDLVAEAQAGICCSPSDPGAMAESILTLHSMGSEQLDRMGKNGRRFYNEKLSLKKGAKKFESIFLKLLID